MLKLFSGSYYSKQCFGEHSCMCLLVHISLVLLRGKKHETRSGISVIDCLCFRFIGSCSVSLHTAYNDLHSPQQIATWLRVYALRFINFFQSGRCEMVSHCSLSCISLVY